VRTEWDAQAAVQADERFAFLIDENGINRAGGRTRTAAIAQLFPEYYPAILARLQGAGGAGLGARRSGAGQAMHGGESGSQATGRVDSNPRTIPGQAMMEQTGAGQGTGVATNTSVHAWRSQNFHRCFC
jgi:hypothetical protein